MKNATIISMAVIILSIASTAQAQLVDKVKIGAIGVTGVATTIDHYNPDKFYNVLPSILFVKGKGYVNIVYDLVKKGGQNQTTLIGGWVYNQKETEDVYLLAGKYMKQKGGSVGLGWEHNFANPQDDFGLYLFTQYEFNWRTCKGHTLSIGFIVSGQRPIYGK